MGTGIIMAGHFWLHPLILVATRGDSAVLPFLYGCYQIEALLREISTKTNRAVVSQTLKRHPLRQELSVAE